MNLQGLKWDVKPFRDDRLARIDSGEIPVSLAAGPSTIIHLMPASAFEPGSSLDISRALGHRSLQGLTGESWGLSYDFEGLLLWDSRTSEETTSYVQLFRNGTVEIVDTALLRSGEEAEKPGARAFERAVYQTTRNWIALVKEIGASGPLAAALTLLDVRGWSLDGGSVTDNRLTPRPIDRDDLVIPEAFLEDPSADPSRMMKALFDPIWNAGGYPGSPSFTGEGAWRG